MLSVAQTLYPDTNVRKSPKESLTNRPHWEKQKRINLNKRRGEKTRAKASTFVVVRKAKHSRAYIINWSN